MADRRGRHNGAAFLGLTFGCARCHDHKYDPISQRDYYAMQAVFAASDRPYPDKVRNAHQDAQRHPLGDAAAEGAERRPPLHRPDRGPDGLPALPPRSADGSPPASSRRVEHTGTEDLLDTGGRVAKFEARFGKKTSK